MKYLKCVRLIPIALCLLCAACQNPGQKVESAKQTGLENISEAERNVAQTRDDMRSEIQKAQGSAVDEAKIEGTMKIAEAKRLVEEEKVAATANITDAEQEAQVELNPQLP